MADQPTILLVDDERVITDNLGPFLERSGYRVTTASDGDQALALIERTRPQLILLDILMPRVDGRQVLRRLRQADDWTPVIMLTQVDEPAERTMALQEGADDYINKPFDPSELAARIRAVLRRTYPHHGGRPAASIGRLLVCGELTFDRQARRATLGSQELKLTTKALALLEYMMTHPDELLDRERLLDAVWGYTFVGAGRTVDTRIAELRRVLHEDRSNPRYIETVIRQGYRFAGSVEERP